MTVESIISHALERPIPSIAYAVSRELTMHFPGKHILETESPYVNLEEFEAAGHRELDFCKPVHSQVITNWVGDHKAMSQEAVQSLQNVTWNTFELQVLQVTWPEG